MIMDKHEQKTPAVHENQEVVSDPLQSLEYKAAIGTILEARGRSLEENPGHQQIKTVTGLPVEATEVKSHSQTVSTDGSVSEDISETPQLVENGSTNSSSQEFIRRLSKLSKTLNRQLASLQETIRTNRQATDLLSGSANKLTEGVGMIGEELSDIKLDSDSES